MGRFRLGVAGCLVAVAVFSVDIAVAAPVQEEPRPERVEVDPYDALVDKAGRRDADPSALSPVPSADGQLEAETVPDGLFWPPPVPPADWAPAAETGFVEGESKLVPELTTGVREVWENPDGSFTEELATSPVRFRDGRGRWQDYDHDLSLGDGKFVPDAAPVGEAISRTAEDGAVVASRTPAGLVGLEQPDADAVAGKVDGDVVVFADVVDGDSDLVVALFPGGFKTSLVVPDGAPGRESFEQVLTVPAGVVARDGGAGVELLDAKGRLVGSYGAGMAYDSAEVPAEAEVFTRLVTQDGTRVTVLVSVDPKWLGDEARVFPVEIDPVFTQNTQASGAMDTYVQSNISTPQANATSLKVGKDHNATPVSRALLRFNTASIVGANRTVTEAKLSVIN